MLYLVATPIGNLEDITYRAVRILSSSDYVLCEDTRTSHILFDHYHIKTKRMSYHRFNEEEKLPSIIRDLQKGKEIALISDAGTPLLCDPGARLVKKCIEEKIPFTVLPGPSSILNGLLLSGFFTDEKSFQFVGFLPKQQKHLRKALIGMALYKGVSLAFLPPSIVEQVLKLMDELFPLQNMAILREMTKIFETMERGTAKELLERAPFKGELLLTIEGGASLQEEFSLEEMVELGKTLFGLSEKEALIEAAKIKKVRKQSFYKKKGESFSS